MSETFLLEISKQGPAVVVVALFLFSIYMILRMVVEGMRGFTETQEKLTIELAEFASTIKEQTKMLHKQTKMIEKQSIIISQLKEVITKLYEELIRKADIIKLYEDNKTKQAEIKKCL